MKIYIFAICCLTLSLIGCTTPTSDAGKMSVSEPKYSQPSPQNVAARMISPATH